MVCTTAIRTRPFVACRPAFEDRAAHTETFDSPLGTPPPWRASGARGAASGAPPIQQTRAHIREFM
eukprot:8343869-Pyramimonas_sp.AAC.1